LWFDRSISAHDSPPIRKRFGGFAWFGIFSCIFAVLISARNHPITKKGLIALFNNVSVIDPARMKETRRIELANGPGMTMFGPDGKYAFVCSSFTPELAVIDVASHKIIKRLSQVSPFCPNIAVTPENDEVWITLKDVGKVQVFDAKPPFEQKTVLDTGPITNHVKFVNNRNGKFAYVTVGGANEVKAHGLPSADGKTAVLLTTLLRLRLLFLAEFLVGRLALLFPAAHGNFAFQIIWTTRRRTN
jgi:DNA-binding beta-propeller fold protein YncE